MRQASEWEKKNTRISTVPMLLSLIAALLALASAACASDTALAPTVDGTSIPTSTSVQGPTASASPSPGPTSTTASSPTSTTGPGTPTPTPLIEGTVKLPPVAPPEFVDNEDCTDINREQLPLRGVIISQEGHGVTIAVEHAATAAQKSQGLMCRASLQNSSGMLFTWDSDHGGGFWMFNTYIPLDIIYFGSEEGGVSFRQMDPCPRESGEADNDWSIRCSEEAVEYQSSVFYRHALELPQGWLESQGFDTENPGSLVVSLMFEL